MFKDKHRSDLKEAHANEVKAMRDTILVQADMIDYLRSKVEGHAYVPQRNLVGMDPPPPQPLQPGERKWLSEEEEEILALKLNGHISELELTQLQETLGIPGIKLAPDLPDE
jgi:hypothetical protein